MWSLIRRKYNDESYETNLINQPCIDRNIIILDILYLKVNTSMEKFLT